MVKTLFTLYKDENNRKLKKIEKKIIEIFNQYNLRPQGGILLEMTFMADMDDETKSKILDAIKPIAEENGFLVDIDTEDN